MFATNHGLTGIVIGAIAPVYVAVPAALASHFILDSLPHYGVQDKKRNSSFKYKAIVMTDTVVALSFAAFTGIIGRWDMFIVGWIAYSPDLVWVVSYFRTKNLHFAPKDPFSRFHKKIQKHEKQKFFIIELLYFLFIFLMFLRLL